MSFYANYEDISYNYDQQRKSAGADVIAGLIHMRKTLKDVHILDAGCGSGNYSKALIEFGVGSVSLMDGSKGMLEKAKQKMIEANMMNAVKHIKHGNLPNIPFDDNVFDAIMINQVLHHLESNADGINFPAVDRLMKEVSRVLKPEGMLIITTTTPEQEKGYWFTNLMPDVLRRFQLKLPNLQQLDDMLSKNGLTKLSTLSYLGQDMYSGYSNAEGPLQYWRYMDSFWSLATEDELNECIRWVKEMKKENTLEKFYKEHDKTMSAGAFTLIVALNQEKLY